MNNLSRYIAAGFTLLIIGLIIYYFSDIVGYVLIAWVLSLVGQPFMRFFQDKIRIGKFRAGPIVSAFFTLICFFVISSALIWMFVPLVVEQARNLAGVDYTSITKALEVPLSQLNNWLIEAGMIAADDSVELELQKGLQNWFKPAKIGNFFRSLLGVAGNLIFALFSIIFITFFFLKDQGLFGNFLVALVPQEHEDHIKNALEDITRLLTRYFGGIMIQVTVITLFVSIALGIVGVKNALLIGFFAAIINVIPYLGPFIGAIFGSFITISSNLDIDFYNEMLPLLGKVIAVFAAMQMLDNFLLQPFIFSNSVQAHPLEIFIVIMVGAKLGGIPGMILAIPAYTVIRVIARVFLSEYKFVQRLTGGMG